VFPLFSASLPVHDGIFSWIHITRRSFQMDLFQIVAVGTILIIFFAGISGLGRDSGYLAVIAQNAPTLLTSAGIFFTFLGIFVALLNFDTLQIDEAIPKLLAGLQLAFLSSVVGIGTSVLFRGVIVPLKTPKEKIQDASAADLLQELRSNTIATQSVHEAILGRDTDTTVLEALIATKESVDSVRESLTGEGDASLSTQFSKLRNDFRDFAETVKESGTEALIQALEEVIKDFNEKISEQFGENFKQLNEAVGALLQWQAEHKIQVEQLTEAFRETQQGIENVRQSLSEVESKTSLIPAHMDSLAAVQERIDQQILELTASLGTLAEVRESAKNLVPEINESIKAATDDLSAAFSHQSETLMEKLVEGAELQANAQTQVQQKFDDSISELGTKLSETAGDLETKLTGSASEIERAISNQAASIEQAVDSATQKQIASQELIEQATSGMKKALETNLESSERVMAEQMTKFQGVLDSMNIGADNIVESTQRASAEVKKIVDDFSKSQEEAASQTRKRIEESIADNSEALNKSMQALDSSMQDQLQRALNLMGNNLTSITNQFVQTYETSAKNIIDLTDRISRDRR